MGSPGFPILQLAPTYWLLSVNINNNVTKSDGADETNQTSINENNQTGDDVNNNNTMQTSNSSN